MLKIGKMILSACATNCFFVYDDQKKDAIVFDPGDEGGLVYEKLTGAGLKVTAIYLTHGHFDHIEGCNELKELSGAHIYALDEEAEICKDVSLNLSEGFGMAYVVEPDGYVHDGEICEEAGISFRVIATPGHTKGSCAYYFEEDGFLIGGDTLFLESVGRTDFPTGSMSQLVRSVKEKLFVLPDEVKVFSGHGEATTIGHEKKYNPFLQ